MNCSSSNEGLNDLQMIEPERMEGQCRQSDAHVSCCLQLKEVDEKVIKDNENGLESLILILKAVMNFYSARNREFVFLNT